MTTLVQILSVPVCKLCDTTSHALRHLRSEYPGIRVERLNMADWPELLERYGLLSFEYDVLDTHAVIIEERLAGTGHPSEDTLRRWLDGALIDEGILDQGIATIDRPKD
jgi:hypothetical protein